MQFIEILTIFIFGFFADSLAAVHNSTVPPYVHQCVETDPEIEKCAIVALHHIRPYLSADLFNRLSKNGSPVEAKVYFPKMKIDAKYTSSGVLIILPATGNGTFHADFTDVYAHVRVAVSHFERDGLTWYSADKMEIDLKITHAHMAVKNIFNNNRILNEAINLFLRENGEEVIRIMMPQLKTKLAAVFKKIANQLLKHINLEMFLKSA
ncbi:uncharacterized protein LOC111051395 [Nilaparvata lugens]|uniref:uncharacterized protein LOC111051395 n=1 Tax=Nilaparvata lugens TaxID=108931 RepID=UPI00193CE230|nr:uncharacterized protein LOC111051395 [Nilaparvata lugens]